MTRIDQLSKEAREVSIANGEVDPEMADLLDTWLAEGAPRHFMIARLVALGYRTSEIAEAMDMTVVAVSAIKGSPMFQSVVKELSLQADNKVKLAREILINAAPKAARVKVDLLDSTDEKVKGEHATGILKGVGALREESDTPTQPVFNVSADKVQLLVTTLKEVEDARRA